MPNRDPNWCECCEKVVDNIHWMERGDWLCDECAEQAAQDEPQVPLTTDAL